MSQAGTQTLTFSQTIANPVFAFVSLNGNGYAFDQDFELLSLGGVDGNACGFWGCGGASKVVVDLGGGKFEYQLNSNGVGGSEPHGALRFTGAFDTVTWRSSTNEFWNGFTGGVQGSAADLIKIAMNRVYNRLKRENRPSRMLLQVHDELVFETPASAAESEAAMVREEMTGAMTLKVPLKVEVGWGKNWQEVK